MGYDCFIPISKKQNSNTEQEIENEITFYYQSHNLNAKLVFKDKNNFILSAGSQISKCEQKSLSDNILKLRRMHLINNDIENFITKIDIQFKSPSAAASFVGGCRLSGNICWKTKENKSPKDVINHFKYNIDEKPNHNLQALNEPIFIFQGKSLKAQAIMTNEGFLLLSGSQISKKINPSISDSTKKLRENYWCKIDDFKTKEDILFKSRSAAASFVGDGSFNGNKLWKTKEGKYPIDFKI